MIVATIVEKFIPDHAGIQDVVTNSDGSEIPRGMDLAATIEIQSNITNSNSFTLSVAGTGKGTFKFVEIATQLGLAYANTITKTYEQTTRIEYKYIFENGRLKLEDNVRNVAHII